MGRIIHIQRYVRFRISESQNLAMPLPEAGFSAILVPPETIWYDFFTLAEAWGNDGRPFNVMMQGDEALFERESYCIGWVRTATELLSRVELDDKLRYQLLDAPGKQEWIEWHTGGAVRLKDFMKPVDPAKVRFASPGANPITAA